MVYEPRTYRQRHAENDLVHFQIKLEETDLDIALKKERDNLQVRQEIYKLLSRERQLLQEYLSRDPGFLKALVPYQPLAGAPASALDMAEAAALAGVGPMAAVAGFFAELAGKFLSRYSRDVIVENGGDIWMKTGRTRRIAVFAGPSPFSYKIGLEIAPHTTPLGICTSSGTVGHSLSFGKADAAVILAPSAVLADAVATATGNIVQDAGDLEKAVDFALSIPGICGALAIVGERLAVRGAVKLVPLE